MKTGAPGRIRASRPAAVEEHPPFGSPRNTFQGNFAIPSRIAADADRGFLDTTLATPATRTGHLLGSIAAQVVELP